MCVKMGYVGGAGRGGGGICLWGDRSLSANVQILIAFFFFFFGWQCMFFCLAVWEAWIHEPVVEIIISVD